MNCSVHEGFWLHREHGMFSQIGDELSAMTALCDVFVDHGEGTEVDSRIFAACYGAPIHGMDECRA